MKKNIDVFDFSEEDELAESVSGKLLEKFSNPSSCNSPVLQRQRIRSFCSDKRVQKEVESSDCAEASTAVVNSHCENGPGLVTEAEEGGMSLEFRLETGDQLKDTDADADYRLGSFSRQPETDVDHDNHGLMFGLSTEDHIKEADADYRLGSFSRQPETDVDHDNHGLMFGLSTEDHVKEADDDYRLGSFSRQPDAKRFYTETSAYRQRKLKSPLSDSSSSQEETDMISADDESLSDRFALSHASDSEDDEDWRAEDCFSDVEKIDRDTAVILTPEYVVLKDMPCDASLVIFSCNGIKVKGYVANNEEGTFSYEFGVEDIINIQYKWYQNIGLIILKIRVLMKDEKCHEDMQRTADIEELKFAVKEHNWPEKQQKIDSLHVKYPAIWNANLGDDVEVSGDNLHQNKRYFPSFDEPFEDVVYPKGDPDAVSICKRDVELLQPETFVNDTIIDFYINYLKNQLQAEERNRYHFFNSFFFRKLADLDKDPSSIADGKAAFLRVRKWTRKVDMFGKDYIFVPVNFNLHWSLIVICHLGEVAKDLDLEDSKKVPCILHMDSIKGSHAGLKNLVQSYLCEEWKERHKETSDDISSRFMNLRFVSLELPQQENSFDCGLFLLHYLELFLAEAPHNFTPFKIYDASNFLYLNWFPPAEASLKRTLIQNLIHELLENRSVLSNEENQSCESPIHVNNNTGVEILSKRCSPLIDCNGNRAGTQDDQGIEMTLLERSSMRNMQAANDSGMVLDLFDDNNTGSLLGQLQRTFEEPSSFCHLSNDSLAREEVDMETGGQFMCMNTSGEGNFQRITGTASPRASISLSSWNLSIMTVQKDGEADSVSETSKGTSDDLEEIAIVEGNTTGNSDCIHEGETGASPPRETVSLFSATVGSSIDRNTEIEELASTQEEVVVVPSSQDDRVEDEPSEHDFGLGDKTGHDLETGNKTGEDLETGDTTSDDLRIEDKTSQDLVDDSDEKEPMEEEEEEKRAAKRPRLASTGQVEEKMEL